MMAFAERWYRFGGGNHEDIMVEFGVTDAVFFAACDSFSRVHRS